MLILKWEERAIRSFAHFKMSGKSALLICSFQNEQMSNPLFPLILKWANEQSAISAHFEMSKWADRSKKRADRSGSLIFAEKRANCTSSKWANAQPCIQPSFTLIHPSFTLILPHRPHSPSFTIIHPHSPPFPLSHNHSHSIKLTQCAYRYCIVPPRNSFARPFSIVSFRSDFQFLIKWKGRSHLHNTWESDQSLVDMGAQVGIIHKSYKL